MPTYSYRCTECETAFDIHQEFTDDSLTVCPQCEGKLRKVFSAVGVTFSGSGFYRTDSRAAEGKKKASSTSSSSSSTPSATSTSTAPSTSTSTSTAPSTSSSTSTTSTTSSTTT